MGNRLSVNYSENLYSEYICISSQALQSRGIFFLWVTMAGDQCVSTLRKSTYAAAASKFSFL